MSSEEQRRADGSENRVDEQGSEEQLRRAVQCSEEQLRRQSEADELRRAEQSGWLTELSRAEQMAHRTE